MPKFDWSKGVVMLPPSILLAVAAALRAMK